MSFSDEVNKTALTIIDIHFSEYYDYYRRFYIDIEEFEKKMKIIVKDHFTIKSIKELNDIKE